MKFVPIPAPGQTTTAKLWLRLAVGVALTLLGLSLLGTAFRTSALPLAIIALLLGVPALVDAGATAVALVRRWSQR